MRFTREQLGLPTPPTKTLIRRLWWWASWGHAVSPWRKTVPAYIRDMAVTDQQAGWLEQPWSDSPGLRITQRGRDVLAEAEVEGGAGG